MSYCFFFTKLKIRKEKKRDRRIRSENKKDLDKRRETKKKQVYYCHKLDLTYIFITSKLILIN